MLILRWIVSKSKNLLFEFGKLHQVWLVADVLVPVNTIGAEVQQPVEATADEGSQSGEDEIDECLHSN